MLTDTHTHIHSLTHTHTHSITLTLTHVLTHTQTHTHMHTHTHTHTHTYTYRQLQVLGESHQSFSWRDYKLIFFLQQNKTAQSWMKKNAMAKANCYRCSVILVNAHFTVDKV